jgi:putative transposase
VARKARVKSSTGIYHIIIRGIDMQTVFEDEEDKTAFLKLMYDYKAICGYEVFGYVVMDHHVHLVIHEGQNTISNIMKRIGVKYVARYNAKYAREGQLFHDRFKSEPIESDDYLKTVLRYIHQEPVRTGAVTEISRYPWSSFKEYMDANSIVDTQKVLAIFGKEEAAQRIAFRKYMNEPSEDKCLEACREKIADADLLALLLRLARVKTVAELKRLSKPDRNEMLKEVKSLDTTSTWQISKVSGFSQSVVAKI